MTFSLPLPEREKVTVTIMLVMVQAQQRVRALTCVAAADVDGQGARGAQGGRPAVHHLDGQEIDILLVAVEARPLGADAGRVVWAEVRVRGGQGAREKREHQ